jgi:AraC-like DNA-binding protein
MESISAALPPASPLDADAAVRVSSIQVRGLTEAVEYLGLKSELFVTLTSLDVARMADPYGWFTLDEFDRLVVAAVELTADPAFGLHWGEHSPMMQYDLAPGLVAQSPTLSVAIECLLKFQDVLANHTELRVTRRADRCVLTCVPLARNPLAFRTRAEVYMAGMVRLLRYLGAEDAILRVNFAHSRPAHGAEYDRIFHAVRFDQPQTSMEIAAEAMERPHPHRNAELLQTLVSQAERLRQRVVSELSHGEQLEQHIRAALPKLLSMAEAARMLGLSERSLRRRLSEEGQSYSELIERAQRVRADQLLAAGNKSVKEIADALGFDSASGFHRAFRRWTGNSPARARSPRARS